MNTTRQMRQREQIKSFLEQQILEKIDADKELKNSEKAYHDAMVARDSRALDMQKLDTECKKKLNEAIKNFNQAMVYFILNLLQITFCFTY